MFLQAPLRRPVLTMRGTLGWALSQLAWAHPHSDAGWSSLVARLALVTKEAAIRG
jgi:hypothetical protein